MRKRGLSTFLTGFYRDSRGAFLVQRDPIPVLLMLLKMQAIVTDNSFGKGVPFLFYSVFLASSFFRR